MRLSISTTGKKCADKLEHTMTILPNVKTVEWHLHNGESSPGSLSGVLLLEWESLRSSVITLG